MASRTILGAMLALTIAAPAGAVNAPMEREYRILFNDGSAELGNGAVIAGQAYAFGQRLAEPTFQVVGHAEPGEAEHIDDARAKVVADALIAMGAPRQSVVTTSAGVADPDPQYPQYSGRVIIVVRG